MILLIRDSIFPIATDLLLILVQGLDDESSGQALFFVELLVEEVFDPLTHLLLRKNVGAD
jgi:hypothetical protein